MVKDKRTYIHKKDHGHDMSYENEIVPGRTEYFDNVVRPAHYLHGKKETIRIFAAKRISFFFNTS